jgi:hypothetical protein
MLLNSHIHKLREALEVSPPARIQYFTWNMRMQTANMAQSAVMYYRQGAEKKNRRRTDSLKPDCIFFMCRKALNERSTTLLELAAGPESIELFIDD